MSENAAAIAVIGMGAWYPGARSPRELWENVLARRQAFRRFRDERMPAAAYWSDDPQAPDRTYGKLGAFLDGFVFDCAARRVPRSSFASTDLSHWLALEVAAAALADAGHAEGAGLPGERTGVIVGNSLTGEFTRATSMRLRWPFVERMIGEAVIEQGLSLTKLQPLIDATGERFRARFPATTEDTLAGALSNTIAGRICGTFDFGGGGYVVDGACSSSLLAVCTAATALEDRRVDACLAGGVDISMDPFELVGFAKAKALTPTEMRVYDRRGNGFIPGEGSGFVLLKRLEDAEAAGDRIYAVIRGWGVSSDGRNAITAPKVAGQARAIRAAWARSGAPDFVEGHGTGTAVGDRVELEAIATVLGPAVGRPVGVTSLKSILGHTKAAAGIGAFLKAVAAVNRRVLPPTAGCQEPNAVFQEGASTLYPLRRGRIHDPATVLTAGVSAMGFGGINTHVVVQSAGEPDARLAPSVSESTLLASSQEAELFVFAAASLEALRERLRALRPVAADLARCELADLSAALVNELRPGPIRAAIVADTPEVLARRIDQLLAAQQADGPEVWLGRPERRPRIGFVCPGQGAQELDMARQLVDRHPALAARAAELATAVLDIGGPDVLGALFPDVDPIDEAPRAAARARLADTTVAQPALCLVSLLWAERLAAFGVVPDVLAGHSLGELVALAIAGAMDGPALMRLATRRGAAMASPGGDGGMLSLRTDEEGARRLIVDLPGYAAIANVNGPRQVVVAGVRAALDALEARAKVAGVGATRLAVSNGFHSDLVRDAAEALAVDPLLPRVAGPLRAPVYSSRGSVGADLRAHVASHVRSPVDWVSVYSRVGADADLVIEIGAGRVLSGLAEAIGGSRCLPVEGSPGRAGDLLAVLASAWTRGAAIRWEALHADRFVRPFVPAQERTFIVNPCEAGAAIATPPPISAPAPKPDGLVDQLLDALCARTGFDRASVNPTLRMREDLNLDSIKAGEIVASVAKRAGVADRVDPAQLSNHPVVEIAAALSAAGATAAPAAAPEPSPRPTWVRAFGLALVPAPPAPEHAASRAALIDVVGGIEDRVATLQHSVTMLDPAVQAVAILQHTDGRFGLDGVGPGAVAHAFARSLAQERPGLAVTLVDLAPGVPLSAVAAEISATPGFTAIGLDGTSRWTLAATPLPPPTKPRARLQAGELVLVTGGARGITAACAAALARATGVRLALVGSTPRSKVDPEVLQALGQLAMDGLEARYWPCDLADGDAVAALVRDVVAAQGPIAAVIHGAGRNTPRRLEQVSVADALAEMAPKVMGAVHLLRALDTTPPRIVCGLTSIIGVSGMVGNAWYAFANETLDIEIARFCARHPDTSGLSLAYGVWDEIGMGAKLGSVATLARMGIGALSPAEGVGRFLDLFMQDPGVRQVVVTAHLDGISTWPAVVAHDPALRFLDGTRAGVPGVDLRLSVRLDPTRDPYLLDHVFAGSLLFPTVYGLEAMAQAAWAARGGKSDRVTKITDVRLPSPVVVAPTGTVVELRALVREDNPDVVDCEVRTETTGFARAHFSATFTFAPGAPAAVDPLPALPVLASPIEPTRDLYGGLLFQGARFQRMGTIAAAADRTLTFTGEVRAEERWLLGDPHFRDTLLQAGQVLIPLDDALPVSIDRITLADGHATPGPRRVHATIDRSDPRSHWGTVRVVDADGHGVERIDSYEVRVLQHHPDRPAFAELLTPTGADATRLQARLTAACDARALPAPRLTFAWEALHALPRAKRRERVLPLVATLDPTLTLRWDADGRPHGVDGRGVSISHDDHGCLVVLADGAIGCDLEVIRPRDEALLKPALRALLPALTEDPATAITRLWAAAEALFKAGAPTEAVAFAGRDGDLVELTAPGWLVLTFVAALARGPRRIVAVALPTAEAAPSIDPESHRVRLVRAAPDRMEARFVVPFDESGSIAGKVPAWALATWMGRLRELALAGLREPLRATLASGRYGMVTEQAGVTLTGEIAALDGIEAHTWVEALGTTSCVLRFAFFRLDPTGPVAVGEAFQRFGFVEVLGHGQVRAAPIPPFLRAFLSSLHHDTPRPNVTPLLVPVAPTLARTSTQTTLLEGNVVGNLYYAHSFKWPHRALDQLLWQRWPALFRAAGREGELRVTGQRVEYLREAMPFDTVEVSVHVDTLDGAEVTFAVVYQRPEADGSVTRLALGQIRAEWVTRDAAGLAHAAPLPAGLLSIPGTPIRTTLVPEAK